MPRRDSYLPEFFTDERLRWYRELTERFPLWCGHWPEEHRSAPEFASWRPERLIWDTLRDSSDAFQGFWFDPEPASDLVPHPVLQLVDVDAAREISEEDWEGGYPTLVISETEPKIYGAWFAAINYISFNWTGATPTRQSRAGSRDELQQMADAVTKVLTERGPEGWRLWREVRAVSTAEPGQEREAAIQRMHEAWMQIGRAAGLLPDVSGGVRCALPDAFLAELRREANQIVEAVRAEEGPESDQTVLMDLLAMPSRLDDYRANVQQERLRKKGLLESLIRQIENALNQEGERSPETWASLLNWPMLAPSEMGSLSPSRRVGALALDLTAGRLPITAGTLRNRTSPHLKA
jgi:hypothetical protein